MRSLQQLKDQVALHPLPHCSEDPVVAADATKCSRAHAHKHHNPFTLSLSLSLSLSMQEDRTDRRVKRVKEVGKHAGWQAVTVSRVA